MSKFDTAWHNADTDEIHTAKGRIAYEDLLVPRGMKGDPNSKPKHGITLLLPKAANNKVLTDAIVATAVTKHGAEWKKKKIHLPWFNTADYENLKDYADAFPHFIRSSANPDFPPFIFGPDAKPFRGDASDIYRGRWAVVTVRPYGYPTQDAPMKVKGVGLGLQRVQLLDHDEAIAGGRVATASGFESVDVGAAAGGTATTADDVFGSEGLNDELGI